MTFQYPIKQLVLSHSALSGNCWRKFELSRMYGAPVEKEEMFSAGVGKALHAGVQEWMISQDETKATMAYMLNYPYETEFAKYDNIHRSFEAGYASLMNMLSMIGDDYEIIKIKTQLKGNPILPAVEVPFAFEIIGSPLPIPVWFVGFIDLVLKNKRENRLLINDIKTHRLNFEDLTAKYKFDQQPVPYGIVLEHALGKQIEEFEISFLSAYIDLTNPKSTWYEFTKMQADVHDWYRGLCEDIGTIAKYYKDQWFRRTGNGNVCYSFNKPCWFTNECEIRDPVMIQRLLNTTVRETLFHDGQEPWITAKLEWKEF